MSRRVMLLPVNAFSTNTARQADSSSGTHGPPNGQPVPVAMSTSMLSRCASAMTKRNTSM